METRVEWQNWLSKSYTVAFSIVIHWRSSLLDPKRTLKRSQFTFLIFPPFFHEAFHTHHEQKLRALIDCLNVSERVSIISQ
jgi:ABC-type phosphate/phosphonate transport system permease subunit